MSEVGAGAPPDLAFALHVADALAGTLNLRRTLGRVVALAVPGLARWASVSLLDAGRLRQVSQRAGGPVRDVTVDAPLRGAAAGRFDDAVLERAERAVAAVPEDLVVLGADPATAQALLAAGPVELVAAPLRANGVVTGLLAVVPTAAADRPAPDADAPRADVRRAVHALASRASVAITNARVYEERATLAATLRAALVPPPLPRVPGLDVGARYRPAHATTEIGGDFFELVERPDGAWMFAIGDVCGKGVEAAVLTGQVRQSLRTADVAATDPAQLLRLVNDTMLTTDGSKFVTVVVGRVRTCPQGAHVRVGSGGHPPPLVLRRDGSVEETPVRGTIVGMLPEARFGAADVLLARGETLLLFTDGVTEARGDDGMLGTDRLRDLLADCGGMRAQAITERLEQLVLDFLDGRPHDDIALLALRAAEER